MMTCPHCGGTIPSPTHITRDDLSMLIETGDMTFAGGFVTALLEAYRRADDLNAAALALGFEWLPDLHAATQRR